MAEIEVKRSGSVEVQHDGANYDVPYYYHPHISGLTQEVVKFPDDSGRPHTSFNHINTSAEPTWNPQGVARRLDEIRASDLDMFLVGTTEEPGDTAVVFVYTAPVKGDVV